jgi:hypothetical protein
LLRPCRTVFLSILRAFLHILPAQIVFLQPVREGLIYSFRGMCYG